MSPMIQAQQSPDIADSFRMMTPAPSDEALSTTAWKDETTDFSMLAVRSSIRDPQDEPDELVKSYKWYPDAVAVDSIFPPGVPLSIKEICIYYPHVRWQDVMASFRGDAQDHMTALSLNQIQRDAVQRLLPAFRTTGYQGKGEKDTNTDHLKPGAYLEKKLKGYTVPTFNDLLCGLSSLPRGEDARALTQCLASYLHACRTFTPKLELNVLHTQALTRAMRQPLEPVVSPNLNRLALEQWQEQGPFQKVNIVDTLEGGRSDTGDAYLTEKCARTQAVFNIHTDPVDLMLHVSIPIRHVLGFPFLALHGVVADAFQMGIDKAEHRGAVRNGLATSEKPAFGANVRREDTPQQTPKRPRRADKNGELVTTNIQTPKGPRFVADIDEGKEVSAPKRPTVSPITPRTSTTQSALHQYPKVPLKPDTGDSVYSRR